MHRFDQRQQMLPGPVSQRHVINKTFTIIDIVSTRNVHQQSTMAATMKNFVSLFWALQKSVSDRDEYRMDTIVSTISCLFIILGKTCLCQQFLQEKFVLEHKETVDEMHSIELTLADRRIRLEILDTAGMDEFPVMRRLAIEHGDAFFIVYAVNDAHSFDIARQMRQLVVDVKGDATVNVPLVIVANKCDIESEQHQIARDYAAMIVKDQWQTTLVETICHQRDSVLDAFRILLHLANIPLGMISNDISRRSSDPNVFNQSRSRSSSKRQSCAQQ
jgi:small GTP-binding protein